MGKTKLVKEFNEHKQDDLALIRKVCIGILTHETQCPHCKKMIIGVSPEGATEQKAQVEAGKLLGRLHKALQIDKQVVKESTRTTKPKLKPSHKKDLEEITG